MNEIVKCGLVDCTYEQLNPCFDALNWLIFWMESGGIFCPAKANANSANVTLSCALTCRLRGILHLDERHVLSACGPKWQNSPKFEIKRAKENYLLIFFPGRSSYVHSVARVSRATFRAQTEQRITLPVRSLRNFRLQTSRGRCVLHCRGWGLFHSNYVQQLYWID